MLSTSYLWLKALHVLFVIFWMAGLFMLPRLFVYHQEEALDSPASAVWLERERRLLRIILWPSLVLVWVFGFAMAATMDFFPASSWFHAKLALVVALTFYHFWLERYHLALKKGERPLSSRRLRMLNEVPGLAAILIVVLVVVKPF